MGKDLQGKIVLITGASSGIGAALGREVARRGAKVALAARRVDRIEALAKEIREGGGEALAIPCDVRQEADLEQATRRVREELGGIDVVVANAGFGVLGRFEELSVDDVKRQFETNVYGMMRTLQATLADIKRARGCVALIGSVSGYLSAPELAAYNMSKAAVRALADTLRVELAGDGVAVLHVAPGFVQSEIGQVDNQGVFDPTRRDPTARLRVPTAKAAREIADAIAARRREVAVTGHGKLAVALARHAPGLIEKAMMLSRPKWR